MLSANIKPKRTAAASRGFLGQHDFLVIIDIIVFLKSTYIVIVCLYNYTLVTWKCYIRGQWFAEMIFFVFVYNSCVANKTIKLACDTLHVCIVLDERKVLLWLCNYSRMKITRITVQTNTIINSRKLWSDKSVIGLKWNEKYNILKRKSSLGLGPATKIRGPQPSTGGQTWNYNSPTFTFPL